ncbi:MAG: hypothetical protein K2Z81_22200 [Cyanobacteria bacterium]|nr:hypothetical protein [Cyanobacteriota bacterium]
MLQKLESPNFSLYFIPGDMSDFRQPTVKETPVPLPSEAPVVVPSDEVAKPVTSIDESMKPVDWWLVV